MLSKRELMRKHYEGGAPESKDQSELFISWYLECDPNLASYDQIFKMKYPLT